MDSDCKFIETHWLTLAEKKYTDSPAFIIEKENNSVEISYKEFSSMVKEALFVLQEKGIRAKEYIPIIALNDINTIKTVFALWFNGSIPVMINSNLKEEEEQSILSQFKFESILTHSHLHELNIIDKSQKIFIDKLDSNYNVTSLFSCSDFNLENDAIVIFTSGSSSKPKGVVHKFKSLLNSYLLGKNYFHYSQTDKWLLTLPIFHIGGFQILIRSLLSGSSVIVPESNNTDVLRCAIELHNPNFISMVPTQFKRLLEAGTNAPQRNKILLGGGKIETSLIDEGISKGWNPYKVYGSSETAAFISVLSPTNFKKHNYSAGELLSEVKIEILYDAEDESSGEIVIKSPTLFDRYLNDVNETSEKLINGKYFSGDYGFMSDNLLFIVNRRTDLIISGGENINPHEIEEVLLVHSDVKEVSVIGIPDEEWGEIVAAVIVPKNLEHINETEIKNFLKSKLTGYKIPKRIFFFETLPKTELGKIKRAELLSILEALK
jgi:O-succinylbenzoic acid--CoA ligase